MSASQPTYARAYDCYTSYSHLVQFCFIPCVGSLRTEMFTQCKWQPSLVNQLGAGPRDPTTSPDIEPCLMAWYVDQSFLLILGPAARIPLSSRKAQALDCRVHAHSLAPGMLLMHAHAWLHSITHAVTSMASHNSRESSPQQVSYEPPILKLLLERGENARRVMASESKRIRYRRSDVQLLLLICNNVNSRNLIDRILQTAVPVRSFSQQGAAWWLHSIPAWTCTAPIE